MKLTDFRLTAKGNLSGSVSLGGGAVPPASAGPSAPPDIASTPVSNTGLNCLPCSDIVCGVDYLTIVLPIPDAGWVYDELESIARSFTDAFEYHWSQGRFIGRQFANWAQSPNGILAVWNLPGENNDPGSIRVVFPGKACARVDSCRIFGLIHWTLFNGGKVNRIDLKADDYSRLMMPDEMIQACHDGNYSGFRQSENISSHSGDVYTRDWTIYLGSRESEKFVRYYNAKPVHDIDAFRFEVEFKDENANAIAKAIAEMISNDITKYNSDSNARERIEDFLCEIIPKLIVGSCNFIDRSGGDRSSRCSRLSWWSDFVERMGGEGTRLSPPKIESTVQKSIAWLERSVAATVAMVCKYTGADKLAYFRHLVKVGEEKMSARHEAIIKASRLEPDRQYPTDEGWVWASN